MHPEFAAINKLTRPTLACMVMSLHVRQRGGGGHGQPQRPELLVHKVLVSHHCCVRKHLKGLQRGSSLSRGVPRMSLSHPLKPLHVCTNMGLLRQFAGLLAQVCQSPHTLPLLSPCSTSSLVPPPLWRQSSAAGRPCNPQCESPSYKHMLYCFISRSLLKLECHRNECC